MKKWMSLLLVLGLLCSLPLSLGSCAKKPAAIVVEALAKTAALEEYEAEMVMKVVMEVNGEKVEIPVEMDMKVKDAKSDHPKAFVEMEMEVMGTGVNTDVYVEGEWAYISMGAIQYKAKAEDAGMEPTYSEDMLKEIPSEILETAEVVENADGSVTLSMNVPEDMFEDIFDEMIESMNETAGASFTDLKLKDTHVKITVKDGYVTVYTMDYTMEMTVMGSTMEAQASAVMTYKNIGLPVTITPPENYQNFPENPLY